MSNIWRGIVRENPIFIIMLGMCPTLAVTTQVDNALGMGLSTLVILIGSNTVVSLIRSFVPVSVRIPIYIVVIASFVTVVDLLLKAFAPALSEALGIFIPLIVVNCIILGRAEAFASRNTVGAAAADGLGMGIGFTLALALLAAVREVLGSGTLTLQVFGYGWHVEVAWPKAHQAVVMALPPGAFLTLGLLMGFFNLLKKKPNADFNTYTVTTAHVARRKLFSRAR